jgi:hypothetical protein
MGLARIQRIYHGALMLVVMVRSVFTTFGVVADTLQQLQTPRVNPMHLSSSWSPYALFKLLRTLEPRLLIKVITNSTL